MVSVFYISNVEDYLNALWPQYRANLAALPADDSTLLVRFIPVSNARVPISVNRVQNSVVRDPISINRVQNSVARVPIFGDRVHRDGVPNAEDDDSIWR